MLVKNYLSKIALIKKYSNNLGTFFNLLINSKRYSSKFKTHTLDLSNKETNIYDFKIVGKVFPLTLRTFRGDIDILYEVFWRKSYSIYKQYFDKEPEVIIDLGAHIGLTSIYFALKYPNARIWSIEVSKESYDLLTTNTLPFPNITCINAAAYPEDGIVNFGNNQISYNQSISESGLPTKALSMTTLMKTYDLNEVDLMKIDIEGGEIELLGKNNSWLDTVRSIIIELHTPYKPSDLLKDIDSYGFNIKEKKTPFFFLTKSVRL